MLFYEYPVVGESMKRVVGVVIKIYTVIRYTMHMLDSSLADDVSV